MIEQEKNSADSVANGSIALKRFVTFFKLPLLSGWLILPFRIIGLIFSCFHSDEAVGLAMISVLYAVSLVLFFSNTRYFLPLSRYSHSLCMYRGLPRNTMAPFKSVSEIPDVCNCNHLAIFHGVSTDTRNR